MKLEWLFFSALLALSILPFFRKRFRAGVVLIGLVLVAAIVTTAAAKVRSKQNRQRLEDKAKVMQNVPREGRPGGYVSSDSCASCHPGEYASWHRSYHRTMTQYATPQTVRGRFDNVTLELHGSTYRLERRGDEFWVEMVDPYWKYDQQAKGTAGQRASTHGPRVWRRIGMMTGSHHMQAYWVPNHTGNLQFGFPFSYLFEDERWVPRNDTFLMDPSLPPPTQVWNSNCIQCHSTGPQPRPEPSNPAVLDTRVGELGIACEACHGPAEAHIEANRNPLRRYQFRGQADPTILNPARKDHQVSSQVCGQCHGIKWIPKSEDWRQEGFHYRPGDDLDKRTPILRPTQHAEEPWLKATLQKDPGFLTDRYWSDGMVRVSGREFNGLVETPCYQKGTLSCLSCHSMHQSEPDDQLGARMNSDFACLQCHKSIRVPEHTHHLANSSGSSCYNCHMPHTTYGLLKAIRSHQIDSPSVESSLRTGRPNACNLCHLDKSLDWTQKQLSTWYGAKPVSLSEEERNYSAAALWLLRGDAGQRALVAWSMGWEPAQQASGQDWLPPYLGQLLDDPYSAVRYIAHRSLRRVPGFKDFAYDYVGSPQERTRAQQAAFRQWEEMFKNSVHPVRPEILIQPGGQLQREIWERLLQQRNNRSMYLQE